MYRSASNGNESMNKEAAEQFLIKGKKNLESRNYVSASHYLKKAKRLDPVLVPQVNSLLSLIPKSSANARPQSTPPASERNSGRRRKSPAKGKKKKAEEEEEKKYSSDDEKNVKDALAKNKSYYEILGIAKESSEKDIKTSYRKKAMKVHPDRNHHPLSTEAFKRIGEAFVCLSDPQKREFYDRHGIDPENKAKVHEQQESMFDVRNMHGHFRRGGPQRFVFSDRDDEFFFHLFSEIFRGSEFEDMVQFPSGRGVYRRARRYHQRPTRTRDYVAESEVCDRIVRRLVSFLIISLLVLFLFNWMINFLVPVSDQRVMNEIKQYQNYYRFEKSPSYSRKMVNQFHAGIEYYVKRDFAMTWKHKIDQVVYKDYSMQLMNKCKKEQSEHQKLLKRLRRERREAKRKELRKKIEETKVFPSCTLHNRLFKSG